MRVWGQGPFWDGPFKWGTGSGRQIINPKIRLRHIWPNNNILRATPSAAGPFWLLGIAIREPWSFLFDILGAILAPRDHFGISGAPWEAILAPRDHPGGPWEQQDGHEVARHRIFVDFGVISGRAYASFLIQKCVANLFIFRLAFSSFF